MEKNPDWCGKEMNMTIKSSASSSSESGHSCYPEIRATVIFDKVGTVDDFEYYCSVGTIQPLTPFFVATHHVHAGNFFPPALRICTNCARLLAKNQF